ncbi:MAG: glycosyltransferase family 2 protein [Anaerolineales bacterium]
MSDPAVSFVIPCYNEELAIDSVLDGIEAVMQQVPLSYEIIVVDDGSTDSTVERCARREGIILERHERNMGTGAARSTGVRRAQGEMVIMTDADGTYPPEAIPGLIEMMQNSDMVIGSRRHEAGTWRWLRSPTKWFIRELASYMTRTRIPDLNSGMRAMRRSLIPQFYHILPNSHSWVSTITIAFLSSGYRVRWMPIDYYPRIGRSTFHPLRDTYNYLTLVLRTVTYFNPLRSFLPVSLLLLGAGFVKAIFDIARYNWHFPSSTVMLVLSGIQIGALGVLADLIAKMSNRPRD